MKIAENSDKSISYINSIDDSYTKKGCVKVSCMPLAEGSGK